MSRPERAMDKSKKPFSVKSITDRVDAGLSLEDDKPDAKNFDHLASPVSPLRTVGGGVAAASSSSSSSGSFTEKPPPNAALKAVKSDAGERRSHSGELSGSSRGSPIRRPGHRRSGSGQMVFSSGAANSTASSQATNVLPAGNICPSGKIGKTSMMSQSSARKDVLGSGSGFYGHGSIMRGSPARVSKSPGSGEKAEIRNLLTSKNVDPVEITKAGNEHYKKGEFIEALRLYDRAVEMCPDNAACLCNRAATLIELGRLRDALKDCEVAIQLNPSYAKAHHRLSVLHLRFGHIEHALRHLFLAGQQPDHAEVQKLQALDKHLERYANARKTRDWKNALREADAVVAAGIDSSPHFIAMRAEALLQLHNLEEADSTLSKASNIPVKSRPISHTNFLGMLSGSYICFVQAQVELALGRFENALASAEKAREIDSHNDEVSVMWSNVKSVAKARTQGNEFFKSGYFAEACTAYGEGLKYAPSNPVLHCNRAACRSKLGQWERSLEDCNEALKIQPNYTKALLRRAASYAKLGRWVEAVRDYEVLRKELPADKEVAEALFHSQISLKMSRGEEVSNMTFGGEVELITGLEQLQAAIALPGVSVVYFMAAPNHRCSQTTPLVDTLCTKYPSLNFLKVDINDCPAVAKKESVITVPTIKIYRNGVAVKEMICPSMQVLELSLRHYGI